MWFRNQFNFWRRRGIKPPEEMTADAQKRNMYDDAVQIDGRDVVSLNMDAKHPWGHQIERRWTRNGAPEGDWALLGEARDGEQLWVRPKA